MNRLENFINAVFGVLIFMSWILFHNRKMATVADRTGTEEDRLLADLLRAGLTRDKVPTAAEADRAKQSLPDDKQFDFLSVERFAGKPASRVKVYEADERQESYKPVEGKTAAAVAIFEGHHIVWYAEEGRMVTRKTR